MCSARRLMLLYICVKFHENISNGFGVTEQTRFCDRQTDRRPGQKQDVSQPYWGRHNDISHSVPKNLKVFAIYGYGSHPGHVTSTVPINVWSP